MSALLKTPQQLFDVAGKVAVVTGATGAFGSVAARVLSGAGCKLVLAGGNGDALQALAADLQQDGAETTQVQRRPDSTEDCAAIIAAAVETYGRVDILVVASGMNDIGLAADMDVSRFEAVMHANVTGSWMMSRAAGRQMIEQGYGGKIVLVSSTRGELGHPAGYSAYCSSKHAVNGITKALGCEWGKERITVNAIAPTVFRSDLTEWMFSDDEPGKSVRAGMLSRIPAGRLGEPEDLAGPLLFLVSPASDFYTGHILYADGGYTAG
jgi:NAD(P)-dependent dehydrogenase (short-subunit alcohol dehydrogenase family)